MFKALMLFMPHEPSKELLLAMHERYGTARVHVTDARVSQVGVLSAPEVWEFIELMGSFSYREIWMTHRYTYRDVVCSSHRPKRDVEHDLKSGGRDGPVYYSAYGDGTPYATLEDADNAAAMLKACIRETARLQGEMDPEKRAP